MYKAVQFIIDNPLGYGVGTGEVKSIERTREKTVANVIDKNSFT